MSIFKTITENYCKKILENYQKKVDEMTLKGKEAKLLIQRNDFAGHLIEAIRKIEVKDSDYSSYFKQISKETSKSLKDVSAVVIEFNRAHKTAFTTDLFESYFISSLTNYINALENLAKNTPDVIIELQDESLFRNSREVPWFYQFSFVLYEYILQREFEIATNEAQRDIFDTKKQMILKFIQNAASLYSRFDDENNEQYKDLMKILLQNMRAEEHKIQQRASEEHNSSSVYSFFSATLYSTTEKLIGKNQLKQKIDTLVTEFDERIMMAKSPVFH
jgi:hypothetical protein